jgi:hypothetical protein
MKYWLVPPFLLLCSCATTSQSLLNSSSARVELTPEMVEVVGRARGEAEASGGTPCPNLLGAAYKKALEASGADFLIDAMETTTLSTFLIFCDAKVVVEGIGVRFRNLPGAHEAAGGGLKKEGEKPLPADMRKWEDSILKGMGQ